MNTSYDNIVADLQRKENNYDVNQLISYLASTELSIVQTILAVRNIMGIDLGEAKEYVSAHPAYVSEHQKNASFHAELQALTDSQ